MIDNAAFENFTINDQDTEIRGMDIGNVKSVLTENDLTVFDHLK
jgi:hypothetical protein